MSVFLDRVFGSCFRTWVWSNPETGQQKYIDYLPKRKWRYNDENLMNDLNDNNSWDVMDLTDDDHFAHSRTSKNMQLRLHDNVFINPLNSEDNDNNSNNNNNNKDMDVPFKKEVVENTEEDEEEEIVVDTHISQDATNSSQDGSTNSDNKALASSDTTDAISNSELVNNKVAETVTE